MQNEYSVFNKLIDSIILNDKVTIIELLRTGISPNCCESHIELTPLHYAAACVHAYEIALILLGAGANVEAKTTKNETPADIAERCGNRTLLSLLRALEDNKVNLN